MRHSFILALLSLGLATRGHAQGGDGQHQYWGGLGVGYGSVGFSCDTCSYRRSLGTDQSRLGGWMFSLEGGWAPSRHVRFGIIWESWMNGLKKGDSLPGLDLAQLTASYSPLLNGGPIIEGGWGYSHYALEFGTGDPLEPVSKTKAAFAAGSGSSYRVGLGWRWKSGFTPRVTYVVGGQPMIHAAGDGTVARGWKERAIFLALGRDCPC